MNSESDSSVMRQVQAGETAHLAVLFERYHVPLFRYLLQLSRDRALSEDLVQEVFFRVLKYAASYDPAQAFAVWLYRMARNACYDALRKGRSEVLGIEMAEVKSAEPVPDEAFASKQDRDFLEEALAHLPEDKREVLVLSRFHNLRYQDIASILKCEAGTVKVRAYRALKELREKFCELRGERLYDV